GESMSGSQTPPKHRPYGGDRQSRGGRTFHGVWASPGRGFPMMPGYTPEPLRGTPSPSPFSKKRGAPTVRPSGWMSAIRRLRLRGLAAGVGAQGRHVEEGQLRVARPEPELRADPDLPRRFLATVQGRPHVLRGLPLLGAVNLLPLPGVVEEPQRLVELALLRRNVRQDVRALRHSCGKPAQVGDGFFQTQVFVLHVGLSPHRVLSWRQNRIALRVCQGFA